MDFGGQILTGDSKYSCFHFARATFHFANHERDWAEGVLHGHVPGSPVPAITLEMIEDRRAWLLHAELHFDPDVALPEEFGAADLFFFGELRKLAGAPIDQLITFLKSIERQVAALLIQLLEAQQSVLAKFSLKSISEWKLTLKQIPHNFAIDSGNAFSEFVDVLERAGCLPPLGDKPPAGHAPAELCSVQLGSIGEAPIVFGKKKPLLKAREYDVISALIRSFPKRLSKSSLETKCTEPHKVLAALRKNDGDWEKAISMAGISGRGYGLAPLR